MAWGRKRGTDDLVEKLRRNDASVETLYIMSTRQFDASDASKLADALKDNTALKELYASGHSIGMEGAKSFGEALKQNNTLQKLCIGDKDFGDEGVAALCAGLRHNSGLKVLDLEFKSIGEEGATSIARMFHDGANSGEKNNETIEELLLSRNCFGDSGLVNLSQGLCKAASIVTLDLSEVGMEVAGMRALSAVISGSGSYSSCHCTTLKLTRNNFGDSDGIRLLGQALATNATLTELWLNECGLGNDAAQHLAAALCNGMFKEAQVGTSVATSQEGLPSCSVLQKLFLHNGPDVTLVNNILSEGASALAACLNSTLCQLNLRNNNIGAEGAKAFAVALTEATAQFKPSAGVSTVGLTNLDVSGNNVGADAAVSLVRCATLACPLQSLSLFNDGVGDEGCRAVAGVLDGCTLTSLDLGANKISSEGACVLFQALHQNTCLKLLELGGNDLGSVGEDAIKKLQAHNSIIDVARDKPDAQGQQQAGVQADMGTVTDAAQTQNPEELKSIFAQK
jgi:Ran GTPase-activating protein (RanGAP) involved in mRNA processing and transport